MNVAKYLAFERPISYVPKESDLIMTEGCRFSRGRQKMWREKRLTQKKITRAPREVAPNRGGAKKGKSRSSIGGTKFASTGGA